MFFLAGLLVAGLAGLLIVPAFARRALRLWQSRARMLAPLSMKEVVAERDLLRAEHALEQHRLERRIADLRDASARHRADLGRQAVSFVALEGKTGALVDEVARLNGELAARARDIFALEADLGASRMVLHDFTARLDRAVAQIVALTEQNLSLETAADDQRTTIAGLETRAAGLEMKLGDAAQAAKSKASATQGEATRLSSDLALRTSEIVRLNAALNDALSKGAITVADLEKKSGELERTRQRLSGMEASAAAREQQVGGSDSEVRRASEVSTQGDLALRAAISQLADDVARLSGAAADESVLAAKPARNRRRGDSRAPSSQGPEISQEVAPAKLRQLQPTAPER
jgi:chromosome segregation ATPase